MGVYPELYGTSLTYIDSLNRGLICQVRNLVAGAPAKIYLAYFCLRERVACNPTGYLLHALILCRLHVLIRLSTSLQHTIFMCRTDVVFLAEMVAYITNVY